VKIGEWWVVYFDHYVKPQYYGAVRSKDLKVWEDVTEGVRVPEGMRHGTVFRVDGAVVEKLKGVGRGEGK
jgi:beta-galactosidase